MGVVWALLGGVLIGLASAVLLWANGSPAGISGMVGGALVPEKTAERGWRLWFLVGLLGAGVVLNLVTPGVFGIPPAALGTAGLVGAGLLVGFGSQLGDGCTSGHGVCGISRGSVRSIVATCTFMVTGAVAVFFAGHG